MAEKRTIELEIQDNSKSLKAQYKEAVQELQKISAQYGETSKEAAKAAARAAELKDQIAFSKDLVDSFNPDAKFDALTRSIGGVLDGFQAFEGAMGLIGVEGEQMQETMLKVQSAMALSEGIQGVMEAKDSFLQLGTVIKSTAVGQAVLTAATAAYNVVVGASTGLMKAFRIALLSTGIGALIAGVGLLIANFDKLVSAGKAVTDWLGITDSKAEKNAENEKVRIDKQLKQQEKLSKQRENNYKNEISIYDRKIKLAEAEGKSTYELEKAKINASIKYQEVKKKELEQELIGLKLLAEQTRFVDEISGGLLTQRIEGLQNLINEAGNNIEDQKTELKILDIEQKKAGVKTEQKAKERLNLARQIRDKEIELMAEGYDKEIALAKEKAKREKEDLIASTKDKIVDAKQLADNKKLIENDLKKSIDLIDEKYSKLSIERLEWIKKYKEDIAEEERQRNIKEYEKTISFEKQQQQAELLSLKGTDKEKLQNKFSFWDELDNLNQLKQDGAFKTQEDYEKAVDALKDKYAKIDLERKRKQQDLIIKGIKDSLQIASDLTQLFAGKSEAQQKKAFVIQKGINIANATVDTYKAATSALRDYPSPFNYIAMAAAITAGLLNIKKIKETQFSTSGSGGGSTPSANAPAPMTPQFNTIGSSGINQLATLQQQPTQAYVVSGEVTSAQALDRNRVQNATL